MKKKYINPEMEVIKIQTTCLLAGSLPQSNDSASTDGDDYDKALAPEFLW